MTNNFDLEINNPTPISSSGVKNLAQLLFDPLDRRPENSEVILSHLGHELERISLNRLRFVVAGLYQEFEQIGIKPKQTVLLGSLPGNNELYISIMFLALSSFGARVFLPMYMESEDLEEWISISDTSKILMSANEVQNLKHQKEKKNALDKLITIIDNLDVDFIDFRKDLNIDTLLSTSSFDLSSYSESIEFAKSSTDLEQEALIITTSGTSGKSKLVVYKQQSLLNSCLSWEAAGFYSKEQFGGRGFTPLFTHTMGIRAFFNAIWTGSPMCLIITDWFSEKPEIVAYLLRKMQPEHITGGPAVFNLFLELIRNFPELNEVAQNSFKCLVGSGAAFDEKFENRIQKQFGLIPHSAYGTTETMQALNTILNSEGYRIGMGKPLPGVNVGMKSYDSSNNIYQLFVKTPFQCDHILNDSLSFTEDGYFISGDLVQYDGENIIYYGREKLDFIKDQFGVKIPLKLVKEHYRSLHDACIHIEYFSINDTPGLAALLFVEPQKKSESVGIKNQSEKYRSYIATANNKLLESIEPFEYNHRSIKRARIIFEDVPKTAKGNPSRHQIKSIFEKEIKELTDPMLSASGIINLNYELEFTDSYSRYSNPYIGQLLHTLGLDVSYHRAKGNHLYTFIKGVDTSILDITGGYGTNLLGHNRDDLKQSAIQFINNNEVAISDQGSIQHHPGELAKKLSIKLGQLTHRNYNVLFGNSGAEAVEMALHHALLAWKEEFKKLRDAQFQIYGGECAELLEKIWKKNQKIINSVQCGVIALKQGFHGNSTGARSVLGNNKKRLLFKNLTNIQPLFIDDESAEWGEILEQYYRESLISLERVEYHNGTYSTGTFNFPGIIASIAEPVIGEGGVREVNQEFLQALSKSSTPLIIDEIQSGLGRCGTFLASEGVQADYYVFGKALGGNLTKLSAVCIDRKIYIKKFGEYYVSTFANGGLATMIGSRVLDIIEQDSIPDRCRSIGDHLNQQLLDVVSEFPDVIETIKGKGLMQGIYFKDFSNSESLVLRNLHLKDKLGYIFSSYLFHTHHIRIFPTLSAPNVLRIEPSAYIDENDISQLVGGLRKLCSIVRSKDLYELLLPLMEGDTFEDHTEMDDKAYPTVLEKAGDNCKKVAFIAHYTHPVADMKMSMPELKQASDTGIRVLFNKMQVLLEMKPFLLYRKNLFNGKINFSFIVVPLDSAQMERMHKMGKRREVVNHIQEAVNMANELGAEVVSLGAYTSIISDNGMSIVEPKGTKVITGNTLTVASGTKHLIDIVQNSQDKSAKAIAVIGAAGNIGSAIAETLVNSDVLIKNLHLIGRNERKLERTLEQLNDTNEMPQTSISTEFKALKVCDIIVIATNTSDPIVFKHHLPEDRNVIITDVSVPSAVHKSVYQMENVTYLPFSSFIQLPYDSDFLMSSVTPAGTTFCCAAESILCGLEPNNIVLKGNIPHHAVDEIILLAEKHGLFENVHSIKSFKEQRTS
ncbi:MAG: aminotransferase class III-fold pyridoxal phosphate-dependent enzyme [Crocinitomicaceae bacterium]